MSWLIYAHATISLLTFFFHATFSLSFDGSQNLIDFNNIPFKMCGSWLRLLSEWLGSVRKTELKNCWKMLNQELWWVVCEYTYCLFDSFVDSFMSISLLYHHHHSIYALFIFFCFYPSCLHINISVRERPCI